ncbi:MAG: M1 family metallopeptidase [Bacteroidota bacterium]
MLLFILPFPGNSQEYFQQKVKYTIHVKLDDVKHELTGTDTIVYVNNSSDNLNEIWMHIWPNAYKDNSTALSKQLLQEGKTFFYFSNDSLKGYIDKLDFKVNDKTVKWEYDSANIDVCGLVLQEPLMPGDSITITTPFHIKIPDSRISRFGHEGQSYQVSQWFPKPAVYDANGWNAFPYIDQGEFYSEFGSFDVYITLPSNYVVGATGDLSGCDDEIEWLEEKAWQTSQSKYFDTKNSAFPASAEQTKTLHYHQDNVHDFAWFADKRYNVLKEVVKLPYSNRKVTTWVMFTNEEAYLWKHAIKYVNDAVFYYSKWIGEYPYDNATAIQGALSAGGGMEYPNITVISSGSDSLLLEMVIMHEVGHNWFYGMLGSNERKYPWLDEGINSFYEFRYLQTKYPGSTLFLGKLEKILHTSKNLPLAERALLYQILAHLNADQPAGLESEEYSLTNYSGIVYEKTAVMFKYLFDYLGESRFDKAMQLYFSEWKFRHPFPADLQKIMENSTGEKLDWFFNDMIGSNNKLDYKICSFKKDVVVIKNKGQIKAPFSLQVNNKETWQHGFEGKQKISVSDLLPSLKTFAQINQNTDVLEFNLKNNSARNHGLFWKSKPLKLQMLPGIDDPDYTQLCTSPLFGYNAYNGFMPGLAVYNNPIPQKKFSYFLLPMYGIKNNTLNGIVKTAFFILPESRFVQYINAGVNASKFSYSFDSLSLNYSRMAPEIIIKLYNHDFNSSLSKEIRFRNVNIKKDELIYPPENGSAVKTITRYYVNEISFSMAKKRKINPYNMLIKAEQGEKFVKSSIEAGYRISYNKPRKGFDIRFFAGAFLYSEPPVQQDFRFRLSGESGFNDYLFDRYYFGRTDAASVFSRQFSETGGGFKIYTPLGQTWKWLTAMNFKASIPGKVPIRLYADIGTYEGAGSSSVSKVIAYDAGIVLSIINNIFEIYFPVAISDDIQEANKLNGVTYWENIRFKLSLEKADPFKALRNIR